MLKFFRHIRKKLMEQNKVRTYLLYAVGEILLVVIGILIALQVNNWNEARKEHQQYLALLENLRTDAETNMVRLSDDHNQAVVVRDRIEQFLTMISSDDKDIPVDTLAFYSGSLFQIDSFSTPATSAYETAKSTGQIGMIKDKTLQELYLEFGEKRQWVEFQIELSGDMVYSTSFWELRKRVGSMAVFRNSNTDPYPNEYQLTEQEYRDMLGEKAIFAAAESMLWIERNLVRGISNMKTINDEILQGLNELLE